MRGLALIAALLFAIALLASLTLLTSCGDGEDSGTVEIPIGQVGELAQATEWTPDGVIGPTEYADMQA